MMLNLERADRELLLRCAREVIRARLERRAASLPQKTEPLGQPGGAFVTLHEGPSLRGCIGRMSSPEPLFDTICSMAAAAAFEDPRFPPLKADELERIDIEITLLSPLRAITDPTEIQVGLHGIYLVKGWQSGVLLPQVATEQGWDRATFLEQTCRKAGLPPGSWKSPDATISIFEGLIFGERDPG
ncbi:MAG TPA: AmmeMemoRadiSam system protein A [Rectinemataceae bacterium]|nr:AmmeMemoRadiSam system protein A [Rectinemataceae bacterium]